MSDGTTLSWGALSTGEKVIVGSGCLAVISLLMPWLDIGIATRNGFTQQAWLILLLGFTYPAFMLFNRKSIDIRIGITLVGIALLWCGSYISGKNVTFGPPGDTIDADLSGSGPGMFGVACIGAIVGQIMCYYADKASKEQESITPPPVPPV
jgi:mannose/fructose/N-acetylgalactosamine-specific phosphotransferase system component IIC